MKSIVTPNDPIIALTDQPFPVVGIGASAGGLEAIRKFLETIPPKSGMAYVYVQHLSPSHESLLPDILQKSTDTPVHLIQDDVQLKPDHVYVIPPDKMLTVVDGTLKLDTIGNRKIKTIDLFFSSLGVVHQSFAIGVVLSGALNDGTLGLQVIKSYGGITFAQDEASATFESMPKSAIQSGAVDFILPANQIIPKLIAINHTLNNSGNKKVASERSLPDGDELYRQLLTILRVRRGVDFTNYKQSTIKRRIIRRIALNKMDGLPEYLDLLRDSKQEQDELFNDLLISVTGFFRDPQIFELLRNKILPSILENKSNSDPLRIWVAGCATGEEAYSIAICLQESLSDITLTRKVQIFATDISEIAINKARAGVYSKKAMEGLTDQQLQQFFTKLDGSYQVAKPIRDMCVFAHHNLLKDPPFSKIDLVSCRNVMIYLEPVLQKKAFATFHYALHENGYLLLGKSETIGNHTEIFTPVSKTEKIYQSKGPHGKLRNVTSSRSEETFRKVDQQKPDNSHKDLLKIAEELLLAHYTPAGVMVNQAYDIIQFRGKTEKWLTTPPGKPSFNVLKMAREGLSFEIRNLLHTANKTQKPVRKEGILFKLNEEQQFVSIEVIPLPELPEEYYLVLFQESLHTDIPVTGNTGTAPATFPAPAINAWVQRIEQLEKELTQTREDMRSITEMQEAANEELQSANEELLSGSEELQSLNEELETSKEELQSTNEEILMINTELLDRNEQLNNSRRYTEEIFNTIHDPLLILDSQLRVLRASEGFYQLFKEPESDTEGRFLYDLGNKQWDIPELRKQLEEVLPKQGSFKIYEVDHIFNMIGKRTMQLSARQFVTHTREKLILLAVHDITDKRKIELGLAETEQLLRESRERLHFAVESAGIGTWDYNPATGELVWDARCRSLMGLNNGDPLDYTVFLNLLHPDDRSSTDYAINQALRYENNGDFDLTYRVKNDNTQKASWIRSKGKAYFNTEKEPIRFIGTVLDVSTDKLLELKTGELLQKKDEFMSIASHELKTPLTSIKAILQLLDRTVENKEELKGIYPLVRKASAQAGKLTNLVKDLLDVTKIQSGKLELEKKRFSVKQLIEECYEQIMDKPKACEIRVEGAENISMFADRNRIEQVITNFLNNAIKYAPSSNIISIRITREPSSIKIAITDHGIGISADQAPHIFERFYRVEETAKHYTGLGLGLYISAEIIKQHHGKIGMESEPGKGSTFWFTIPAIEGPE